MRRLPIVPTLVVALAVAAMIALGIWQLRRAQWKEALLAQYAAAAAMPALDLDPLLDGRTRLPPLSFRRALVTCRADDVAPEIRAGRSAADLPGQAYSSPCRPGAGGPGRADPGQCRLGAAARRGAAAVARRPRRRPARRGRRGRADHPHRRHRRAAARAEPAAEPRNHPQQPPVSMPSNGSSSPRPPRSSTCWRCEARQRRKLPPEP